MCIWGVRPINRHCEYCTYRGGCEVFPVEIEEDLRPEMYIAAMSDIVGIDIRNRTKYSPVVWGRHLVCHQLRMDGYSLHRIADLFGLNHTSVINGEKRVRDMFEFPTMYRRELKMWNEFQRKLT